jgi:hypothetical protein
VAGKRTNHVRAVSVITVARSIVPVNAAVQEDNLSMLVSKEADSGVVSTGLSKGTACISGIAKTSMVCIQPAVCHSNDDARSIQSEFPKGVICGLVVFHEGSGDSVPRLSGQDRLNPKDSLHSEQCINRHA